MTDKPNARRRTPFQRVTAAVLVAAAVVEMIRVAFLKPKKR